MPKKAIATLISIIVLSMFSSTAAAKSIIRINCEGADQGAKIYVNGEYMGDCPSDVITNSGNIKLRVVKEIDREHEKIYEQELYLADKAAKRIEVQLSGPQLSAAAIKARELKKQQQEKQAAEVALTKAKKGDVSAMKLIAQYYENGTGVPQSSKNAGYWKKKAQEAGDRATAMATLDEAKSGNVQAMRKMAQLYAQGTGVEKNNDNAKEWELKADSMTAQMALESAKKGDIDAMREISKYYAMGTGVERNMPESERWSEQAQAATEKVQQRQQQAREIREAKNELARIDFDASITGLGEAQREHGNFSLYLTSLPFASATDLVLAPTKTTETIQLKSRIASRPSTFARPDSMIAKAYNQKSGANN